LRKIPGSKRTSPIATEKGRRVAERVEALAREAAPPLILREALGVVKSVLFGSVTLPGEEQALEKQP
jgi:hypothetical protein